MVSDQDFTHDDWVGIQKRIDQQYEKKLKEVGDTALKKLKSYQAEHKALIEKTQYLIDHSRIEDEDDFFSERPQPQTERKSLNDRNRFFTSQVQEQLREEDYLYKQPVQLKNSAKGPQVVRKSQPPVVKSQPRYQEQVTQSAPAKRYIEQPMQPVQ